MTLLGLVAGIALVAALVALAKARRLAARLERLTESYWELRYEHGQLRARVNRLDPDQGASGPEGSAPAGPTGPTGPTNFVPLSSLKRQV